jgi:DNA-directed RNA polymerase subunit L
MGDAVMELRVLREDKRTIEFALKDVDISVLHILQKVLFEDPKVLNVSFRQEHPITKTFFFYVEVSKGNPRKVMMEGCKRASTLVNKFKEEFLNVLEVK